MKCGEFDSKFLDKDWIVENEPPHIFGVYDSQFYVYFITLNVIIFQISRICYIKFGKWNSMCVDQYISFSNSIYAKWHVRNSLSICIIAYMEIYNLELWRQLINI